MNTCGGRGIRVYLEQKMTTEKSSYFQNNVLKKTGNFILKFEEFNLKLIFNKYKANNTCRNFPLREVELNPPHPSVWAGFSDWLPKNRVKKGKK